jgi:hypothetical protein
MPRDPLARHLSFQASRDLRGKTLKQNAKYLLAPSSEIDER